MLGQAAGSRCRRTGAVVATAGLVGASLVAVSALPAQAASEKRVTNFSFDAQSYGSKTKNNPAASSGATALSYLGCTRVVPRSRRNFEATAGDNDGVQLNAVRTRNFTREKNRQVSVISTARIDDGKLADGAVRFSNAKAKVVSSHNRKGFVSRTASTIGRLRVNGLPVDVPLNGTEQEVRVLATDGSTGTLTINYQVKRSNRRSALGGVNVLRYQEDGRRGTIEKVGRAFSRIDGNVEGGIFGGQAYGTKSRTAGTIAQTGKSAKQPMPCPGTNGQVLTTDQVRVTTDFGVVGEQFSAAYGEQNGQDSADGYTLSRIVRVNIGNGTLVFRNIQARARVVRKPNGNVTRTAKRTGIGTILVNGEPQSTPAAGQQQDVVGLGSYRVKVVNKSPIGLNVTAVVVTLNNGTPANTSDDTVVQLGNAKLKIRRA